MFVDSVSIFIGSGHGGAGAVSFRREKFVIQGGPDGGDGGRGGDVYFLVDKNTTTLAKFRGHKKFLAGNGMPGMGKNCNGKKGKDIVIKVPPGTQIINEENNEILLDLLIDGEKVKLLSGGKGGLGNTHFKNASNQRPTYAQKGLPGISLQVRLELKLIADIALVGFPNVGKSSLISTITNARPKIADYAFTTLIPNLGVVDIDDLHSFVIADIPGLIQGASTGKGLGLQFLQHIERTKLLLFMLDSSYFTMNITQHIDTTMPQDSDIESLFATQDLAHKALLNQFSVLYNELLCYAPKLANRYYAIAFTKSDVELYESFCDFSFKQHENLQLQTKAYISQPLLDFIENGISMDSIKDDTSKEENCINNEKGKDNSSLKPPLFILPISSATHCNLESLKTLLYFALQGIG